MTKSGEWTAFVLAGQRPGIDPLAHHFGQDYKALVPIAGEAMLTHVVRTLGNAPEIARIFVLSQAPEQLFEASKTGHDVKFVTSGGGISSSIRAVVGSAEAPWPILVTTADHPLLTTEMIAEFVSKAESADLSVAMVEKKAMLVRFPDARRTWLKFSDGHWSGANLFALRSNRVVAALDLWAAAEQDRKTAWKLFLHFGPWLALRALTRTIGLADALGRAGKRLGLSAKLVSMSDPVAAIDVDKPSDHEQASFILESRQ